MILLGQLVHLIQMDSLLFQDLLIHLMLILADPTMLLGAGKQVETQTPLILMM
jgi:hypothetical protein